MRRLRAHKRLKLYPPPLDSISDTIAVKILFQNVRSLHLHVDDVLSDFNVQAADLNIFVETALCSHGNDYDYSLDGFKLFRNNIQPQVCMRTAYGSAMYLKNSLECVTMPFRYNYNEVEMTITIISHPSPTEQAYIVGIYRSKTKVKLSKYIEALDYLERTEHANKATIIFGDFNVDLDENPHERNALISNMIESKGYTQLISSYTTDYRTKIDHIYTNIPQMICASGVLESYYSDHKPIYAFLKL